MAVIVHIPGPLRNFADGQSRVEIDGSPQSVSEVFRALGERYPGIRHRVLNEQGGVREHINIFVGEESIRYTGGLDTPVPGECEIFIIPAVSGG